MNDLIKGINAAVFQSELCVMEAIINMIDKETLITGYDNECACADIIMESMIIFMESKNRVRDRTPRNEISKWMEKENLWYTGSNPNKKKLSNRIYHFLQQHDFNPSDGTYKSDIKLKDGSYKRIKLNIEINGKIPLTQREKDIIERWKEYYVTKNKNGNLSFDWHAIRKADPNEEETDLMDKLQSVARIHGGDNAFYNDENDEIYLSSDTLKDKQSISQITLKHEEGHAYDMKDNDKSAMELQEINEIKNDSLKYKKDAAKIGMRSNDHDIKDTESYADAYSVKHAKIRTKDNSVRNVSNKELLKHFQRTDRLLASKELSSGIDDCIDDVTKVMGTCNTLLEDKGLMLKYLVDLTNRVQNIGMSVEKINNKQKEIDTELALLDKTDDELKKLRDDTRKHIDLLGNGQWCKDVVNELNNKLDIIEDFLDGFKPDNVEKHKESLNKSLQKTKDQEKQFLKKLQNRPFFGKAGFEKAVSSGILTLTISNKDIDEIVSKAKTREEADSMILNKMKPMIKRLRDKLNITKKQLEEIKKMDVKIKDTSTRVRYEFAKQFIKEYFDELSDGMCYYD